MKIGAFVVCSLMLGCASGQNSGGAFLQMLEEIRRRNDVPALGGAIMTCDKILEVAAVGVRKRGGEAKVAVDDQWHLGSDTKAMTATLIAMLVEGGKLSWSDTIAKTLPELRETMQPAYRDVTLQQLLCHRGGFSPKERSWPKGKSFNDMHNLKGNPLEQRYEYLRMVLKQEPEYPPGSRQLYSNMGYTVAAAFAEKVMGKSWEELMRRFLFEPLGMKSAGFGPMGDASKLDQPWQHFDSGTPVKPIPINDNPDVIAPGGKVHCSLADWAKFVQLHLQGEKGTSKLLKPETLRYLHKSPYNDDYAFGWLLGDREWAGGKVLTHAGSNNQNYCVVSLAPKKDIAVLATCNQGGDKAYRACDEVVGLLLSRHIK